MPASADAPALSAPPALDALRARLAALRDEGAWRLDPQRFNALEALARRAAGQHEAVRRVLEVRLAEAVARYAERVAKSGPLLPARAVRKTAAAPSPLSGLNAYIREVSPGRDDAAARQELASVRRFRRAWSSRLAQDQLAQAAARKPANAGPLNSHALVLDSLARMREISPDYLQRFLAYVESLQWLERAVEQYPARPAKAARGTAPAARRPRKGR